MLEASASWVRKVIRILGAELWQQASGDVAGADRSPNRLERFPGREPVEQ